MKLTTFIIIILAAAALVFGTLYFAHPRERIVEKPVPQVSYLPSKPDTIYKVRIKFVPVTAKPDTEYVFMVDTTAQETVVSEKEFSQLTAFGELKSTVRNYALCPSIALSDSAWFPEGEQTAMNRIKKEVAANIPKQRSRFWMGFTAGACLVSSVIIVDHLIK